MIFRHIKGFTNSAIIKKTAYVMFIALTYCLFASSVEHSFLQKWRTLESNEYTFEQFVSYQVKRPYAYRLLMPILINLVYSVPSLSSLARNEELISRGACLYVPIKAILNWKTELRAKYIINGFIMFLFLLLAMFALRGITKIIYSQSILADIGPALFAIFLPLTFRGEGGFMYDFSELGLYFLGLYLLLKGRNFLFLLLLPVIILNKEADLFILIFSAIILFSSYPKKKACVQLGLQGLVALGAFFIVKFVLVHAPGATVEYHFKYNLYYWSQLKNYFSMMTTSAFFIPIPKINNILLFPLLLWLLIYHWKEKPLMLRRLFNTSALISFPLFFLCCWQDEFRNLSLMFPFYYLLACHTIICFYPIHRPIQENESVPGKA